MSPRETPPGRSMSLRPSRVPSFSLCQPRGDRSGSSHLSTHSLRGQRRHKWPLMPLPGALEILLRNRVSKFIKHSTNPGDFSPLSNYCNLKVGILGILIQRIFKVLLRAIYLIKMFYSEIFIYIIYLLIYMYLPIYVYVFVYIHLHRRAFTPYMCIYSIIV